MDKQNLKKTALVLEDLNASLKDLRHVVETKKYAVLQQRQSYKANMAEKNSKLEKMEKAVSEALVSVDRMTQKIDMVLNEDGSGNNNN